MLQLYELSFSVGRRVSPIAAPSGIVLVFSLHTTIIQFVFTEHDQFSDPFLSSSPHLLQVTSLEATKFALYERGLMKLAAFQKRKLAVLNIHIYIVSCDSFMSNNHTR